MRIVGEDICVLLTASRQFPVGFSGQWNDYFKPDRAYYPVRNEPVGNGKGKWKTNVQFLVPCQARSVGIFLSDYCQKIGFIFPIGISVGF